MTDPCARLPAIATAAIHDALVNAVRRIPDVGPLEPDLQQPGAVFVTLERGEQLLGCVGTLAAEAPLLVATARYALAAAFDDPRVPPITTDDYTVMSVKVSVLSSLHLLAVSSRDELVARLRPSVDGVLVEAGRARGTFLPSVWEKVPDPATFVEALWQKAGLPTGAWPAELQISTYTTAEYHDPGPRTL